MRRVAALAAIICGLLTACPDRTPPTSPVQDLEPAPRGDPSTSPSSSATAKDVPGRFVSRLGHLTFRYPTEMRRTDAPTSDVWLDQEGINLHHRGRNIYILITAGGLTSMPPPRSCNGNILEPEPHTGGMPRRCTYREIGGRLWAEIERLDDDETITLSYGTDAGPFSYLVVFAAPDRREIDAITRTLRIDEKLALCKPYDWIERASICDEFSD